MKKNLKSVKERKDGVLYIRYNKDTLSGLVIERLKKTSGRRLNDVVLNLIVLSELVEPLDWYNIDIEVLNYAYYESLKLFSDKLNQAKHKINNLSSYIIRQKYQKLNSFSILEDTEYLPSTCEINQSRVADSLKTLKTQTDK